MGRVAMSRPSMRISRSGDEERMEKSCQHTRAAKGAGLARRKAG
jgi:hypothetical protein